MRSAAILAVLPCVLLACSSSSQGPSPSQIFGAWQFDTDAGYGTVCSTQAQGCTPSGWQIYFDSNGSGGESAQRVCIGTWTYAFDGTTLTITPTSDAGVAGFVQTSQVSFSGNTMTLTSSRTPDYVWSRINAGATNTCP